MPKLFTPPAALLVTSVLLATGCGDAPPPQPAKPLVLVQAAVAGNVDTRYYTGEIRARHEVDLGFRVGGKLAARLVDVGADVRPGQPLARLDPADLQLAASAARAQLAAAESDLTTAQAERERYAGLVAKKFVSQAAFEARDNAYNSARARLEQARSQSRISGNQAEYGTLQSEFPAIVTAVLADAGQVLSAGQPVLRLARPEEKEVLIAVPESRFAELKAAKRLSIALWALPELSLDGEVRELSPAADPVTRTYAARIRIANPPPEVKLGMTARVALAASGETAVLVPLGAVVDQGQGPLVWVIEAGKATPRPVRPLSFREDGVAIAEGLRAGERVVVAGTQRLIAGQDVEAREAPQPALQR